MNMGEFRFFSLKKNFFFLSHASFLLSLPFLPPFLLPSFFPFFSLYSFLSFFDSVPKHELNTYEIGTQQGAGVRETQVSSIWPLFSKTHKGNQENKYLQRVRRTDVLEIALLIMTISVNLLCRKELISSSPWREQTGPKDGRWSGKETEAHGVNRCIRSCRARNQTQGMGDQLQPSRQGRADCGPHSKKATMFPCAGVHGVVRNDGERWKKPWELSLSPSLKKKKKTLGSRCWKVGL